MRTSFPDRSSNQLNLILGNTCQLPESYNTSNILQNNDIPCSIFLKLSDECNNDHENNLLKIFKIHRVVFLFPDSFFPNKFTKNMTPFIHKFQTKEEIDIKVLITLEDGSDYHFLYHVILRNVRIFMNCLILIQGCHSIPVTCRYNPKEKRSGH